jgi:hypothetical protein
VVEPFWRPHQGPQEEFCARGDFEVLFGGAAGPGKTDCLIIDPTRDVWHERFHGLILRRTFPQLQEIIDRCFTYYPLLGGDYRATEHRWYFPSGAKITLGHMQHENDKYNYQGKEYQYVGFDELTQFTQTQYLYLFSRCRSSVSGLDPHIRSTTNPGGIGHNWVKKRFIDVAKPMETYVDPDTGLSRAFVPATVYDNPTLMQNDPEYIRRLEALPEIEKLRLLHGIWDAFEGQVFTELSQRVHGSDISSQDIPPEWERLMVFDWGYGRPWCALWFAVDYEGVLWLYREHYGMRDNDPNLGVRQTNQQICRTIHQIEMGQCQDNPGPRERGKVRMRIADPACWSPTKIKGSNQLHGPSFYEDASREGLFFVKADNNRLLGKQQVHQRFEVEEEIDHETGEVIGEHPRFIALTSCRRWWEEFQNLYEDPKNTEDVDTGQPDEGYDCTRYVCMARPVTPKRKQLEPQGTFQSERKRLINARKYAQRHGVSLQVAYQRVR